MTKLIAQQKAAEILRSIPEMQCPPFCPFKISTHLKGVIYRPLSADKHELSARVFFDSGKDQYVCEYNEKETIYRQNFAMAFMLGHIILGHLKEPGKELCATDMGYNSIEDSDACDFALALLIPRHWLVEFLDVAKSVTQLAEAFVVSNVAITTRIKQERLI